MQTSTIVFGTLAALATATVGYAVYFDYKRRNDAEFRRALKREKKKAALKKEAAKKEAEEKLVEYLSKAIAIVKDVEYPTAVEDREKFFTSNLQQGEILMKQDPSNIVDISVAFYKAVKVYPNPIDLLVVLQKSLPEDVVGLLYGMISTEAQAEQGTYYDSLTSKMPSVKIMLKASADADAQQGMLVKRGVHAKVAIKENDVIIIEDPAVTCLKAPVMKQKSHCHFCMSAIPQEVLEDPERLVSADDGICVFKSASCHQRATNEFYKYLVGPDGDSRAMKDLMQYCIDGNTCYPYMVARFLAKMIGRQLEESKKGNSNKQPAVSEDWEHLEKLPVSGVNVTEATEKETELVCSALITSAPGIKEFLTSERYTAIKTAIAENSLGIYSQSIAVDLGDIDRPKATASAENVFGAGLFYVASYIQHSDKPNAMMEFTLPPYKFKSSVTRKPKVVVRALCPIAVDEEITINFKAAATPLQESNVIEVARDRKSS